MTYKNRADLVAEMGVKYLSMGADAPLDQIIATLVGLVPDSAFEPKMRFDSGWVYLVGSLDDEEDNEGAEPLGFRVVRELNQAHLNLPASIPIRLVISSEGGPVDLGLAVQSTINEIRREGRKVIGHVAGCAFSSAFDILQACDYRTMEATAGILCHENQYISEGASTTARDDDSKFDRKMEKAVFNLISKRTGKPTKYYQDKVRARNWSLDAQEALAEGLVDEIVATPPFAPPKVSVPKVTRRRAAPSVSPPPEPVTPT